MIVMQERNASLPVTVRPNPTTSLGFSCFRLGWRRFAGLATVSFLMLSRAVARDAGGWELAKHDGEVFVSVESMKKFYGFDKLAKNGNKTTLEKSKVRIDLTSGAQECSMNGVKFILCRPAETIGGKTFISRLDLAKLIDPVLRPRFIKKAGNFQTVVLDPGHGGKDAGAVNSLGTEAGYNLKVAKKAETLLKAGGYKVVMTRSTDHYLTLQERVNVANAVREEAIFISIHFNSGNATARGIETFTLSPPGVAHYGRGEIASDVLTRAGNEHDSANIALATAVHGTLLHRIGTYTFDRGIKRARFSVLSGVRHPAILMEGGFMSHSYDARLIASEGYQNALARSIFDAVTKYRYAVGGKTLAAR